MFLGNIVSAGLYRISSAAIPSLPLDRFER
jgi:hypothetical protein